MLLQGAHRTASTGPGRRVWLLPSLLLTLLAACAGDTTACNPACREPHKPLFLLY